MGSMVVDDAGAYASKSEAMARLEEVRRETLTFLESISEADLDKPVKGGPPEFETWGSIFALIPSHEAHHGGQISVIWRRLGHKPRI